MSFGDPNQNPNNPYGQQPPQGQPGYGYPQQAPGTIQANSGYINIPALGTVQVASMGRRLGARAIDGVVIGVLYGILSAIGLASAMGIAKSADDCGAYYFLITRVPAARSCQPCSFPELSKNGDR